MQEAAKESEAEANEAKIQVAKGQKQIEKLQVELEAERARVRPLTPKSTTIEVCTLHVLYDVY